MMTRIRLWHGKVVQDRLAFVHIHPVHTNVHSHLLSGNGFVKTVNHDAARPFVFHIVGLGLVQQLLCCAEKVNVPCATEQTTRETVCFLENLERNECGTAARDTRIDIDQITASGGVEEHVNAEKAPKIERFAV